MRPCALLALPLLAALTVPRADAALPAAAKTIGCPAYGYSMRVPSYWTVSNACSARSTAKEGGGLILTVTVEKHGYWNDSRSRSSIRGDARTLGIITGMPAFQQTFIGGRAFLACTVDVAGTGGKPLVFVEMETFADGRLYKFAARIASPRNDAVTNAMGTALKTITISEPAAPVAQPPAQATSPDAPGVVVTATGVHTDAGASAGSVPPHAGAKYLVIRVTIANNGSGPYRYYRMYFSAQDRGDNVRHQAYAPDTNITATALDSGTLSPGDSVSGDLAFEVPAEETRFTLLWQATVLSGTVHVPLR